MVVVAVERLRVVDRHRRDPGRDLARIRGDVELRDGPGAAHTAGDVIPVPLAPDAEGRDDADAGDHHTRLPIHRHGVTIMPSVFAWTGAALFVVSLTYFVFS